MKGCAWIVFHLQPSLQLYRKPPPTIERQQQHDGNTRMKRVHLHTALLAFGALTIMSGCSLINTVDGSGDIKSEVREVPAFKGIVIKGSADAIIKMGTTQHLEITTDDNILPILTTEVSDGILTLDSKESYSSTDGVKLEITVPQMESITIKGSGDITVNGNSVESLIVPNFDVVIEGSGSVEGTGLNATNTDVRIKGSGTIRLSGKGGALVSLISGSGEIFAGSFATASAKATIRGSGEIHINASKNFEGDISGSGTIYYSGNPEEVITSVSGSGEFIKN